MNNTMKIWVTSHFIAQHRWKDCPYEEVSFLRNWHRHIFHVKVTLSVKHDDRDLEFFMVKKKLINVLSKYWNDNLDMSCEMFAEEIGNALTLEGIAKKSIVSVEVSEDGENGAIVFFQE